MAIAVGAPEIQKGAVIERGRASAFPLYFSCRIFTFRANATIRAKPDRSKLWFNKAGIS